MDFGLERTKGTFNPDVLPRRRTVGSLVIRHCFVLVPPFVFVSLLNVQLARALRCFVIVMITRSTRELQLEETLLKRGSIKIQYLRKFEGRVTRFGRKPEKYIDRCVPFFFAFFLDVLRALSTTSKISRRRIRSLAGEREGEREREKTLWISLHEFEQVFRSLGRERCLYLRNGRNIVEQTAILFPNILYFDRLRK